MTNGYDRGRLPGSVPIQFPRPPQRRRPRATIPILLGVIVVALLAVAAWLLATHVHLDGPSDGGSPSEVSTQAGAR